MVDFCAVMGRIPGADNTSLPVVPDAAAWAPPPANRETDAAISSADTITNVLFISFLQIKYLSYHA
jgi:hypothetical protein